MPTITLLTDFGCADWYVAAMKGVILHIAPQTTIIDLTHYVPPGDITTGAFSLAAASPFFAPGTIHVAVVDPGVGSARLPLVIETERQIFLGPDNGILALALGQEKVVRIH